MLLRMAFTYYHRFKNALLLLLMAILGITVFGGRSIYNFDKKGHFFDVSPTPLILDEKSYPICNEHEARSWHGAAVWDEKGKVICVYGHEHGDNAPTWLVKSEFRLGFDQTGGFMANTSEYENSVKHVGMKGFAATIKGVEVYARVHLASNVLDRSSRYHSYELFLKDPSGGVSHFQGWLDTGDPIRDRIAYRDTTAEDKGKDPGTRPIVWAATKQACLIDQTWCIELWAMRTWGWGPDLIWGINDATTFYQEGEENSEDVRRWNKSGGLGTDRSLTVTIYREPAELEKRGVKEIPVGEVWATQFGEIVSGPLDPKCSQKSVKFGQVYPNICLRNYISATLPQITGVGNTAQKQFEAIGVRLPN